MNKIFSKLKISSLTESRRKFRRVFASECKAILELIDRGKITRQEGCYQIAGFMTIDAVRNDFRLLDVCMVASELELPDKHVSGNIKEKWQLLKRLVSRL